MFTSIILIFLFVVGIIFYFFSCLKLFFSMYLLPTCSFILHEEKSWRKSAMDNLNSRPPEEEINGLKNSFQGENVFFL